MATKKKKSGLAKYRNIVVAIVLFLGFDAGILSVNYYMSAQIAQGTAEVNISAQQSVVVQEMAKNVMNIDLLTDSEREGAIVSNELLDSDIVQDTLAQIEKSQSKFDFNLNAFTNGVIAENKDDKTPTINQVTTPYGLKTLKNIQNVWSPYKRLIDSFLAAAKQGKIDKKSIAYTVDYIRVFNDRLYYETSDLTKVLEQATQNKARYVQYIQLAGIVVAILLFLYIVLLALRQLLKTDEELEEARKETSQIMATVNEGLFLIDNELQLGNQYSSQLEEIIGKRDIGGQKLTDILATMISESDLTVVKTFVKQLYNERVVEDLIHELNPLNRIRVQVDNFIGGTVVRFLDFKFSRIYSGDEISRALVSVTDVTEAVRMEERLEQEREQNDQQIKMLNTILNTDSAIMTRFINTTQKRLQEINAILRKPEKTKSAMLEKSRQIYREIHSLKGEASAINLSSFVATCETFEENVKELQSRHSLKGNDFLSLTVILDELIEISNLMEKLNGRLGRFSEGNIISTNSNTNGLTAYFQKFADDIAARNDKSVVLRCDGLDNSNLNESQQNIIKDLSIQFLRNAIVHGIETEKERLNSSKSVAGVVHLLLRPDDNGYANLIIEDDGQGIDYAAIKGKAVEKGIYNQDDIENISKRELTNLLFSSGFSTAKEAAEDAGRGVGMDIVRDRIRQLNGSLKISTVAKRYTRFIIKFPFKICKDA